MVNTGVWCVVGVCVCVCDSSTHSLRLYCMNNGVGRVLKVVIILAVGVGWDDSFAFRGRSAVIAQRRVVIVVIVSGRRYFYHL